MELRPLVTAYFVSSKFNLLKKAFLLIIFINTSVHANEDFKAILSLLPFNTNAKSKIKTQKCNIQKQKWINLLLTHEQFEEKIKYNQDCDLEGNYTVQYNKNFPIKLNVKNSEITEFNGNMLINIEFREKPFLVLKLIKSKIISSKDDTLFDYLHEFQIDPFSQNPIKKNLGGTFTLYKDGKKITKKMAP